MKSPGESDDVAAACQRTVLAPFLQHFAVLGDLVLALLGRDQVVRIDIFEPDEDAARRRPWSPSR